MWWYLCTARVPCVALRCVASRCVALRCVALRCVALRDVALRLCHMRGTREEPYHTSIITVQVSPPSSRAGQGNARQREGGM